MLSQGLLPTGAELAAARSRLGDADAPLPCPGWCDPDFHRTVTRPDLREITHSRVGRYVDLPDRGGFILVRVVRRDSWRPTGGWRVERPAFLVQGSARGAWKRDVWNARTLRPLLEAGPLLVPGLLELILEAADFCGIKIPEEYAR